MNRATLLRQARLGRASVLRTGRRLGDRRRRSGGRHQQVVTDFDAWGYLADLLEQLSALLEQHGVEHLILDEAIDPMPRLAVRRPDLPGLVRALAAAPPEWWVSATRGGIAGRPRPARRAGGLARADGLLVVRNLVSPSGVQLTDSELGVAIDFWTPLAAAQPRSGGSELPAGTLVAPETNGVLDYLDAAQWATAQPAGHRLPASGPHLLRLNEPVDLVYTWVDGNDPEWAARKARYWDGTPSADQSHDAALTERFDERDELRYSLRSVQQYADWARRIWIVTDQQRPAWLVEDDRLTVVDHRDIFRDPAALPVFNSHAIESQVHHIDGLADKYLYLNDDTLFGAPVRPEQFYFGNGLSKIFQSMALIDAGPLRADDNSVTAAAKNNRTMLENDFGRTITNKLWHTPKPHSRALMTDFEGRHPELFDTVMRSRFRSGSDYSLASTLYAYYAFANHQAVTSRLRYGYLDLGSDAPWTTLEQWLRHRNLHCLCVNDGTVNPSARAQASAALAEFLEAYFPLPSRWERS